MKDSIFVCTTGQKAGDHLFYLISEGMLWGEGFTQKFRALRTTKIQ